MLLRRTICYSPGILLTMLVCILLSACSVNPIAADAKSSAHSSGAQKGSASESQIAQAVFAAINKDRAAANLPALQWSSQLAASAHQHNLAMKAANTLSHQLPNEAAFGDRERQQGVQWWFAAENIGETSDQTQVGALGLHKAMMAEKPPEDGHRQNILTKQGTILGVDVLIDTQNHILWLTEDFARV
jgi:uncharacterized protein YkwD